MAPPALTESTIRYLFATSWLPSNPGAALVRVPGGSTTGLDTGASLLDIAMWNLRRQGLVQFEQLREVVKEPIRVFGGPSFSRFKLLTPTARLPGLEGALLEAARDVEGRDRRINKAIRRASGEDKHGVRRLVRELELDNKSPWGTVCSHCFTEASAAGLIETNGRFFWKTIVISDPAAVESLRERHDELRAARGEYRKAEPELKEAVATDCLRTLIDAYSTDSTPGD